MEELEKIDEIIKRTRVNYQEAAEALRSSEGNLVDAIVKVEQEKKKSHSKEEFYVKGQEVIDKIKELIKKGNVARIKVKSNEKVLVDIPVTAGVVGTILAPYLAVLAGITAVAAKFSIEIERNQSSSQEQNNAIDKVEQF